MAHFTEENIIGSITLDESDGLQNEQFASSATEDNNDDDIDILDADTPVPAEFIDVLEDLTGELQGSWDADTFVDTALSNYGTSSVTGTVDLSGSFTAFSAGTSLIINGAPAIILDGISTEAALLAAINGVSGATGVTATIDTTGVLVLSSEPTDDPNDPIVISGTNLGDLGLVADTYTTDTSFATTKFVEISGDSLDYLRFSSDLNGEEFPLDGFGLVGVDSGLYTLDGNKIFIYLDPNSDTLIGREGFGDVANPDGDPILAVYLEQWRSGDETLIQARMWTVQFEPIFHPDDADPDDAVDLTDVVFLTATDNIEFDASNAPSGQNLFIMFGTGDGVYDYGIVATGKEPINQSIDPSAITSGDTVNTSQAGGPTTFGINNQMIDETEGIYFTFVQMTDMNYTVPNLDQNEADIEANILFTGGSFGADKATFDVVQLQGGKTAVVKITAYDSSNINSGDTYIDGQLSDLGAGGNVDVESVLITGTRKQGNVITDVTFYADLSTVTIGVAEELTSNGYTMFVTFNADGTVEIDGVAAGDTIKYETDGDHNRVLIENTGDGSGQDSASFDVGGFQLLDISSETQEIGSHIFWEDDGITASSPEPLYVEEEQIDNSQSSGNEDDTDVSDNDIDDAGLSQFDNITDVSSVNLSTLLTGDGVDQPVKFSFDSNLSSLPATLYSKGANILYDSSTTVETLVGTVGGLNGGDLLSVDHLYVLQIDDDGSGLYDPGETILVYTSATATSVDGFVGTDVPGLADPISIDGVVIIANPLLLDIDAIVAAIDAIDGDGFGVEAELNVSGEIVISNADGVAFSVEGLGDLGIADATYNAGDVDDLTAAISASGIATAVLNLDGKLEITSESGNAITLSGYSTDFGLDDDTYVLRTYSLVGEVISVPLGSSLTLETDLVNSVFDINGETFTIDDSAGHDTLGDLIDLINAGSEATAELIGGQLVLESPDGDPLELNGFNTTDFGIGDGTVFDQNSVALGSGLAGGTVLTIANYNINGDNYAIDGFFETDLDDLIALINAGTQATASLVGGQLVLEFVDDNTLTLTNFDTAEFGIENGTVIDTTRTAFTWDVREDGESTFQVVDQLDHPGLGEDTMTVALGSILEGADADGDPVDLGDLGTYGVIDDVPEDLTNTSNGIVEEEQEEVDGVGNEDANGTGDADTTGPDVFSKTTHIATGNLNDDNVVDVGTDENLGGGAAFSLKESGLSTLPDLKSLGQNVVYDIQGNTIYGYVEVGGVVGEYDDGDRLVFTFALSGTNLADWTFTLYDQLDHQAANGENSVLIDGAGTTSTIDFSGAIEASDYDNDKITLDAGSVYVTAIDDVPEQSTNTSSGTVEEEQAEVDGIGNEDANGTGDADTTGPDVFSNTTHIAFGNLNADGVVKVGADELSNGNNDASFSLKESGLSTLPDLKSLGENVVYDIQGNTIYAYVEDGTNGGEYNGGEDRLIFTFILSGTNLAIWTFTLYDQLDHVDGNGENTALKDGAGSVNNIDFSGVIEASDYDGDKITLDAGSVYVNVIDDVPILEVGNIQGTGTSDPQIGEWVGLPGADEYKSLTVKIDSITYGPSGSQTVDGTDIPLAAPTVGADGELIFTGSIAGDFDGNAANGDETLDFTLTFFTDGTYAFDLDEVFASSFTFSTDDGALPAGGPDPVQTLTVGTDAIVFFALTPTALLNDVYNLAIFGAPDEATLEGAPPYFITPMELMNVSTSGIGVNNNNMDGDGDPNISAGDESFVVNPETDLTQVKIYIDNSVGGYDEGPEKLYYTIYYTDGSTSGPILVLDSDLSPEAGGQESFTIDWDGVNLIDAVQVTMALGKLKIPTIEFTQTTAVVLDPITVDFEATLTDNDNDAATDSFWVDIGTDDDPELAPDIVLTGTLDADAFNIDLAVGFTTWVINGFDSTDGVELDGDKIVLLNPLFDYNLAATLGDDTININGTTVTITNAGDLLTSADILVAYADVVVDNLEVGTGANELLTGLDDVSDVLIGKGGVDTLEGGTGGDVFVFVDPADGPDIVTDFDSSDGDFIVISASGFGLAIEGLLSDAAAGDPAINGDYFVSGPGATANDADDYFLFDTTDINHQTLWFDPDGNTPGGDPAVQIADFGSATLTDGDIFIIA